MDVNPHKGDQRTFKASSKISIKAVLWRGFVRLVASSKTVFVVYYAGKYYDRYVIYFYHWGIRYWFTVSAVKENVCNTYTIPIKMIVWILILEPGNMRVMFLIPITEEGYAGSLFLLVGKGLYHLYYPVERWGFEYLYSNWERWCLNYSCS